MSAHVQAPHFCSMRHDAIQSSIPVASLVKYGSTDVNSARTLSASSR